jgi:hypothetical protein
VPVYASSLTGQNVFAGKLVLSYNSGMMFVSGIETAGTLLQNGPIVQFNATTRQLAFATHQPLTGSGVLVRLKVATFAAPSTMSDSIKITSALFNEGSPATVIDNGRFRFLSITVAPKTPSVTLVVGDTLPFSASGDVHPPLSWSTSDAAVGTMTTTGVLRTHAVGQLKVLVQDAAGLRDSTNLFAVNSPSLRSLTLSLRDTAFRQTLTFDLPLYITDVTSLGIISSQFTLTYSSSILQAVDVIQAGSKTSSWLTPAFSISGGRIDVALAGSQPLSGAGILVFVRFRVGATASGSTTINISNVLFNESIHANNVAATFTALSAPTLVLSPNTAILTRGQTQTFTVTSGGTPPYTWSTLHPAIATIDPSTGTLTAVARGTTAVRVVDALGFSATSGSIVINDIRASLPDTSVAVADSLEIPLFLENVTGLGIIAFDFRVSYNSGVARFREIITAGTMSNGFTVTARDTLDTLRVAAAGPTPLAGAGVLLKLRFKAVDTASVGNSTPLRLLGLRFNEPGPSTPTATHLDGLLRIGNLPPVAPVLSAPANGATGVSINPTLLWNASPTATSYRLQISTTTTFEAGSIVLDRSGIATTSHTVSGLSHLTTYFWRVSATGSGGTSSFSVAWSFTTIIAPPTAPTAIAATQVTTTSFIANWNSVADATAYRLDVSSDSFVTFVQGYQDLLVVGVSQSVTGLTPATTYQYRVRAVNTGGTSPSSNVISVTTLAPPPPAHPAPSVTSVTPNTLARGDTTRLDVSGSNFLTGITTFSLPPDFVIFSSTIHSITSASIELAVRTLATPGRRSIIVSNAPPGGGIDSLSNALSIVNPAPILTSITPDTGVRSQSVTVRFIGNKYITGVTSVSFGPDVTLQTLNVENFTSLTATLLIGSTATAGTRTATVTNAPPGGGSATLANAFVIANPRPTLNALSPQQGSRGQTLDVQVTGSNFLSGVTTISFGSDIAINSTTISSSTLAIVNITIAPTASLGPRDVRVIHPSPGGGSSTLPSSFTVGNPSPALTSLSPSSGQAGETLVIGLVGNNFLAGVTSVTFGDGIAVNSFSVAGPTQATANITIAPTALPGPRDVTVTNPSPGGGSTVLQRAFTVLNPAPTLTGISPSTVARGTAATLVLTGSGFVNGVTAVDFGPDIAVTSLTVQSTTSMTVTMTMAPSASLGARTVRVINTSPGGGIASLVNALTVVNPAPTLTSLSPSLGGRGQSLIITIVGQGFISAVTSVSFGADISVTSIIVDQFTQLRAFITISPTATAGTRDVIISNAPPGGGVVTLPSSFSIGNPAPTITSVAPIGGTRGSSLDVTIQGTGFFSGVTSVSFGDSISINSVTVLDTTTLRANISIALSAPPGSRTVTITNAGPGGGTAALPAGFQVLNPAPTLSSIAPTSAGRGSVLRVTVNGNNFLDGVTGVSFGMGVSVTNVIIRSLTDLSVDLVIDPTAPLGPRDVTVTNLPPGGGATTLSGAFTVTSSPATSLGDAGGTPPSDLTLFDNFPNPFNPSTTIRFGIPSDSYVRLSVYTLLGEEVAVLLSDERTSGYYNVTFEARNLPTGVYLVRLSTHSPHVASGSASTLTRKLLLLR